MIDVQLMQSISVSKTVEKLRTVFATYGLPRKVITDNGPTFTSSEFRQFMEGNGIKHSTMSSYHPSSNGLAERAVQVIKQALRRGERRKCSRNVVKVFVYVYHTSYYNRSTNIRIVNGSPS